jgi:hypothetical protein
MSDDLDLMLGHYDAGIRELALQACDVIAKAVPKAEQKVYAGWRSIGFSLDGSMATQFCAVGPQQKYVNIYLMRGTELDDPKALLEGTGKKMRHVKIKEAKDLKNAALKALIKEAAKLAQAASKK